MAYHLQVNAETLSKGVSPIVSEGQSFLEALPRIISLVLKELLYFACFQASGPELPLSFFELGIRTPGGLFLGVQYAAMSIFGVFVHQAL